MLDLIALSVLLPVFVFAGALTAWTQTRYLGRYRQVRGVDPSQSDRVGAAPWLFFGLLRGIMRDTHAAYSTPQPDPELEQLRQTLQRWRRIFVGVWALMMTLAILRLAGIA